MSAVGEQAVVDDPAPEYVDAKMNVNIDSKNETVIPNPMEPMSEYNIKLKCEYDREDANGEYYKRSVTGDLYDDELPKWKDGKYIGNRDEFSCYPYFAMEYNEAHFGKNNDGKLALVFNDFIALCHRDSVGDFITYMKYDEQQKKMVIDDVEFNPVDYDFVG